MGVEIGVRNLMVGGEVYGLDRVTFRSSNMLGLPMPATFPCSGSTCMPRLNLYYSLQ
jgi:hypothetical protein